MNDPYLRETQVKLVTIITVMNLYKNEVEIMFTKKN